MAKRDCITSKTGRSELSARTSPYWHKISTGHFVGYRKTTTGGTWQARFESKAFSKQKSLGSDAVMDFKEAQRQAGLFCDLLDEGVQTDYTVNMAIDDYCKDFAIRKNAHMAFLYGQRYARVLPEKFKQTAIHELTTRMLSDWISSRILTLGENPTDKDIEKQRQSKSSVKRDWAQVKAMLNFAYKQGMVATDVEWKRVKGLTSEVESARKIFFTDQQVQDIIKEAREPYRAYFKATLLLGTRPGEWADPRVEDFDGLNRTINIGRKTGKRHAVLSADALDFIKLHVKDKLPKALVFADESGRQWKTGKLNDEFQRIAKKLNLPKASVPYCLRHYFISHAMAADIQILLLARNCGTSVKMIEEHYGKFRKSTAIEQLDLIQIKI